MMASTLTLLLRGDAPEGAARDLGRALLRAPWEQLGNKKGLLKMSHYSPVRTLPGDVKSHHNRSFLVENHCRSVRM